MVSDDHIDPRGHHRRGMDQCADRRGAFHGIRQPGVQRQLRRFPDGADQKADGDCRRRARSQFVGLRKYLLVVQGLEIREHKENRDQKSGVPDAIDHKGFGRCLGGRNPVVVIADQQIGTEPHAFPADEQHRIVVAHHQQKHRDHEQVHIGKEAGEPFFTVHVAD